MRTHDRTKMTSLFWAQFVKSNWGSRPCCKRTDRYKESHRRWNLHVTMAKWIVTAEKKTIPIRKRCCTEFARFAFVRNENRSWKWTSYRRLQRANIPNTAVNSGDNASSRTSLALHQFSKRNRSMFVSFCSQQLTTAPKQETIRKSLSNHRVSLPPRHQKDLKRTGMCINESDRPPYLSSFLWRQPQKEYETKRSGKVGCKYYFIPLRSLLHHVSVSFMNEWKN